MSNKEFINNLSATYADVRKLDVKKINLKGKNILEYIKESVPTIKHSQDTRETVTENDLWGQYIETLEDGTVIIHDDEIVNPNAAPSSWNINITKVEDNKAYVGEDLFANIQTEKIKDGNYMFIDCENLTTFSSDLSSLTNGYYMFTNCTNLTSFDVDLSNLTTGTKMFGNCPQLTLFTSDLSSLTYSEYMFDTCTNLKSISFDLSSLTDGRYMFSGCENLKSISFDLSSLTNSTKMFSGCSQLISFKSDSSGLPVNLSSLIDATKMFDTCTNLTTFNSDLPSLTNGSGMFGDCTNLTSFTSNLSSLINGKDMFASCNLDAVSVMYIAATIKDIAAEKQLYESGTIPYVTEVGVSRPYKYSDPKGFMSNGKYVYTYKKPQPYTTTITASNVGNLTLGINVSNNEDTIQQQLEDFAKEATFESWDKLKTHFSNRGWTVTFQYGGTTTGITLSEDEKFRGVPVYARLIEVTPEGEDYTEEEKASAEYCTEDGTKYYNIDWGHDVTDYDQYQYFGSLLEACGYYGIIPKKYLEEV